MLAEQHDPKKGGFHEEGCQHFIAEQGAGDIAGLLHEARPVGAELEAHRDARHNADGERKREYLYPEVVGVLPIAVATQCEAGAEIQQYPAQADGNGGEQNVETDVGGKLQPRQQEGIKLNHGTSPVSIAEMVIPSCYCSTSLLLLQCDKLSRLTPACVRTRA